ncbi:hypothetical protein BD324DRAFT_635902 [Kockovaella imperatae]|uniref:SnoaL-like domain-containing protein n=1 Tax=Kockovaella imperatae TaxID=4999 RepID=A0A1Y1UA57_9TREE|nr:hypothetical protein BD324DRAFT_635902 [Kockovaella imperatae]ORX34434.1 hypothetical protein BD324DRAFT_635902 [Kockovaella imperatae]
MVYHTIVKSIAVKNFEAVNTHDYESILKGCAPNIRHRFGGNHALGGTRNDKEALNKWFHRLGRLYPNLKLTVRDVWVKGWPHDTRVFIRWTAADKFADGTPYDNHGVHVIRLCWGKAVEIDANEDSQVVDKWLRAKMAEGVTEAGEPAIES